MLIYKERYLLYKQMDDFSNGHENVLRDGVLE